MTKETSLPNPTYLAILIALTLPFGSAAIAQVDSEKIVSTEPPELLAQQEAARTSRNEALMQGRFDRRAEAHGKDPYRLKPKATRESSPQIPPSQEEDATGTLDYARLLTSEEHPMPLDCGSTESATLLGIYPPSVSEFRLMLPGRVDDFLSSTSAKVQKYISDTISAGEQARAKQRDKVSAWTENALRIRRGLADDSWVQYQFALEVNRYAKPCLAQIAGQTDKSLSSYTSNAQRAVNDLTPILPALPDARTQTEAYRMMLQLRDSAVLARTRFEQSEGETTKALNQLLSLVPQLARPAGIPPTEAQKFAPVTQTLPGPITRAHAEVAPPVREDAPRARAPQLVPEALPAEITYEDESSSIFGYLFIGLTAALSIFGVMRFIGRRRVKKLSKK